LDCRAIGKVDTTERYF